MTVIQFKHVPFSGLSLSVVRIRQSSRKTVHYRFLSIHCFSPLHCAASSSPGQEMGREVRQRGNESMSWLVLPSMDVLHIGNILKCYFYSFMGNIVAFWRPKFCYGELQHCHVLANVLPFQVNYWRQSFSFLSRAQKPSVWHLPYNVVPLLCHHRWPQRGWSSTLRLFQTKEETSQRCVCHDQTLWSDRLSAPKTPCSILLCNRNPDKPRCVSLGSIRLEMRGQFCLLASNPFLSHPLFRNSLS